MVAALLPQLSPGSTKVFEKVWESVCPVCAGQSIGGSDFVQKYDLCVSGSLFKNVEIPSKNPPYNLYWVWRDGNSGEYILGTNNLVHIVKFGRYMMVPWSYGHMFCSALQLQPRLKALVKETATDSDMFNRDEDSSPNNKNVRRQPV